jgi:hypothetical protein
MSIGWNGRLGALKLHHNRCVLPLADMHFSKSTRKHAKVSLSAFLFWFF